MKRILYKEKNQEQVEIIDLRWNINKNKDNIMKVLEHSSTELQRAEQKFGPLATINSIMISGFIALMVYFIQCDIIPLWGTLSIFIPLISLQLLSIVLIIDGMNPRYIPTEGDSTFFFKDLMQKDFDSSDAKIISDAKKTIKIYSILINSKYKRIRIAMRISFPFIMLFELFRKSK
ncbi:MAG: hypothetical protein KAG14_04600 [Mycoplasmataceae bacterium]|nr:hypothetical protein [Mycoplasmataceae bacterium]